jgi:hypothetical protein
MQRNDSARASRKVLVLIALISANVFAMNLSAWLMPAQQVVTSTVRVDQPDVKFDPLFYGIMTEAISDAGTKFSHELPASSESVIRLKTR